MIKWLRNRTVGFAFQIFNLNESLATPITDSNFGDQYSIFNDLQFSHEKVNSVLPTTLPFKFNRISIKSLSFVPIHFKGVYDEISICEREEMVKTTKNEELNFENDGVEIDDEENESHPLKDIINLRMGQIQVTLQDITIKVNSKDHSKGVIMHIGEVFSHAFEENQIKKVQLKGITLHTFNSSVQEPQLFFQTSQDEVIDFQVKLDDEKQITDLEFFLSPLRAVLNSTSLDIFSSFLNDINGVLSKKSVSPMVQTKSEKKVVYNGFDSFIGIQIVDEKKDIDSDEDDKFYDVNDDTIIDEQPGGLPNVKILFTSLDVTLLPPDPTQSLWNVQLKNCDVTLSSQAVFNISLSSLRLKEIMQHQNDPISVIEIKSINFDGSDDEREEEKGLSFTLQVENANDETIENAIQTIDIAVGSINCIIDIDLPNRFTTSMSELMKHWRSPYANEVPTSALSYKIRFLGTFLTASLQPPPYVHRESTHCLKLSFSKPEIKLSLDELDPLTGHVGISFHTLNAYILDHPLSEKILEANQIDTRSGNVIQPITIRFHGPQSLQSSSVIITESLPLKGDFEEVISSPWQNRNIDDPESQGPFMYHTSIREDTKYPPPKPLPIENYNMFQIQTMRTSFIVVELSLLYIRVEIEKSNIQALSTLAREILTQPDQPQINQNEPSATLTKFTSFTMKARIDSGIFVILGNSKMYLKFKGYKGTAVNYACLDLSNLSLEDENEIVYLGTRSNSQIPPIFLRLANYHTLKCHQNVTTVFTSLKHIVINHALGFNWFDTLTALFATSTKPKEETNHNTLTKIFFELEDTSIRYSSRTKLLMQQITDSSKILHPPDTILLSRSAEVLFYSLSHLDTKLNIQKKDTSPYNIIVKDLQILVSPPKFTQVQPLSNQNHWMKDYTSQDVPFYEKWNSFVKVGHVDDLSVAMELCSLEGYDNSLPPTFDTSVKNHLFTVNACSDSLKRFYDLVMQWLSGKESEVNVNNNNDNDNDYEFNKDKALVILEVDGKNNIKKKPPLKQIGNFKLIPDYVNPKSHRFSNSSIYDKKLPWYYPRIDWSFAFKDVNIILELCGEKDWDEFDVNSYDKYDFFELTNHSRRKKTQPFTTIYLNSLTFKYISFLSQSQKLELKDKRKDVMEVVIGDIKAIDGVKTSLWKTILLADKTTCSNSSAMFSFTQNNFITSDGIGEYSTVVLNVNPIRIFLDQDTRELLSQYFRDIFPEGPESLIPFISMTFLSIFLTSIELAHISSVSLQLDYNAKHVHEMNTENLMNLFSVKDLKLQLPALKLTNCHGWQRLSQNVLHEGWMKDIKDQIIAKYPSKLKLIQSLSMVGSGIFDLVLSPIKEVKDGGSVVTGLAYGTTSFLSKLYTGALNGTLRVVAGTSTALQRVEGTLIKQEEEPSIWANQPQTVAEGLHEGLKVFSKRLETAAENLIAIPLSEYEKYGASGYLGAVLPAIPLVVISPVRGTLEGVTKIGLGVLSQTRDAAINEVEKAKYKDNS